MIRGRVLSLWYMVNYNQVVEALHCERLSNPRDFQIHGCLW